MNKRNDLKGVLGLGKASTNFYLNKIHNNYSKNRTTSSTSPLILYQIDFQEINPFLPRQFKLLIPKIEKHFLSIAALGITRLLVPNITLHETIDQINHKFELSHPVELMVKYLKKQSLVEATIFGTHYSMNADYLKNKFLKENIKIQPPSTDDQIFIDDFRTAVFEESETSAEIEKFKTILQKYLKEKPVILACTELSLFAADSDPHCIDMADLQIADFLK